MFWISKKELSNYRLVDDFEDMIKVMEDDMLNEFYYHKNGNEWQLTLM